MFVESLASAVEKAYWLVTVLYNLPAAVSTGFCFSPCPTLLSPPFPNLPPHKTYPKCGFFSLLKKIKVL